MSEEDQQKLKEYGKGYWNTSKMSLKNVFLLHIV